MVSFKKAFYCWHTKEDLKTEKEKQMKQSLPLIHKCEHRDLTPTKKEKEKSIIRFRNDAVEVTFKDLIKGEISFNARHFRGF